MKVWIVRKYLKTTRMEYNRSSPFEEVEFQTKEEAITYRESQKKGVFDIYQKEFKKAIY